MPRVLWAYVVLWVSDLVLKLDLSPKPLIFWLWKRSQANRLLDEEYGITWIKNVRR